MGTGLHRVFLCFLFSCLGWGIGWPSGHGGLGQPALPMGERKTNFECRMLNVECRSGGGFGGPAKADFDRKWTRMDANGGRKLPKRRFSVRKQELFMKTGWERAFIVFSCVSCFPAWVGGSDGLRDTTGWANPPYRWERGKTILNVEFHGPSGRSAFPGKGGHKKADRQATCRSARGCGN